MPASSSRSHATPDTSTLGGSPEVYSHSTEEFREVVSRLHTMPPAGADRLYLLDRYNMRPSDLDRRIASTFGIPAAWSVYAGWQQTESPRDEDGAAVEESQRESQREPDTVEVEYVAEGTEEEDAPCTAVDAVEVVEGSGGEASASVGKKRRKSPRVGMPPKQRRNPQEPAANSVTSSVTTSVTSSRIIPQVSIEKDPAARRAALIQYRSTVSEEECLKPLHRKVLEDAESADALFLRVDGTVRAVLLFTTGRRARHTITLVHTQHQYRGRGFALELIRFLQHRLPSNATISVDSPACTARAAVGMLLSCGFVPDISILHCELAVEYARVGNRSVQLSFFWAKTRTRADELMYESLLKQLVEKHRCMFLLTASQRALGRRD